MRSGVGDDQIRPAVPVEVRDRDRLRTGALPEVDRSCRLEGAVAVAEQHRGGVVAGIRQREILHEVAIEVARRHGCRTVSRRVVLCGPRSGLSAPTRTRHAPGTAQARQDVALPTRSSWSWLLSFGNGRSEGQVSGHHEPGTRRTTRDRQRSRRSLDRRVDEHRDRRREIVGDRDVQPAVAVEVGQDGFLRRRARPEVLSRVERPIALARAAPRLSWQTSSRPPDPGPRRH